MVIGLRGGTVGADEVIAADIAGYRALRRFFQHDFPIVEQEPHEPSVLLKLCAQSLAVITVFLDAACLCVNLCQAVQAVVGVGVLPVTQGISLSVIGVLVYPVRRRYFRLSVCRLSVFRKVMDGTLCQAVDAVIGICLKQGVGCHGQAVVRLIIRVIFPPALRIGCFRQTVQAVVDEFRLSQKGRLFDAVASLVIAVGVPCERFPVAPRVAIPVLVHKCREPCQVKVPVIAVHGAQAAACHGSSCLHAPKRAVRVVRVPCLPPSPIGDFHQPVPIVIPVCRGFSGVVSHAGTVSVQVIGIL